MAKRRNDSAWRAECLEAWGHSCVVCGATPVQMDHIMPRSQGGESIVWNGLPLCEPDHRAKTEHRLLIRPEWLSDGQRAYLRARGWVWWDETGRPCGRGMRSFDDTADRRQALAEVVRREKEMVDER